MKRISVFLVLGAFLLAFTSIMLWRASGVQPLLKGAIQHQSTLDWQAYYASGEYSLELSAFVLAIIATGVLIVGFVLLASHLHISHISPKVLAALRDALNQDKERDPRVRYKVAVGLSELDMEESSHHYKHDKLDDILIHTLQQDPDYRVRSKAAEGLTEVELEPLTHHKHNQLEDALLEDMAQAFKEK